MGFEDIKIENNKQEKISLYPERAFLRVDKEIERIEKIRNGEIKKIELNDVEKKEVLKFEDLLGEKLEKINDIKIKQNTFYVDYFLTDEGRRDFIDTIGSELEGDSVEEVEMFILKNRSIFKSIERKKVFDLVGRSRNFSEEKSTTLINETMTKDGEIDIEGLNSPCRVKIIINPGEMFEKIQKLRELKSELKIQNQGDASDNVSVAKRKISDLYRKKINTSIADLGHVGIWVNKLAKKLGDENELAEGEKKLKNISFGLLEFEKIFSRYDRFEYGADAEYDEDGMRRQVGADLIKYADEIENRFIEGELKRKEKIREKGLNPEKIDEENIAAEEFSKLAEEFLEFYGQKSSQSAKDYDPKRKYAAPDNKWQFVAKKEHKSAMSIDSIKKVIKSDIRDKSIVKILATLLGHEFTHFLQAENREKINLRLFGEKMGGLRSEVFAEAGAMTIENEITTELFGYEKNPKPHYIRAMVKKLEGGNYLECVKTYFDSSRKTILKMKELGLLDDSQFKDEIKDSIETAIKATKRLFREGDTLNNSSTYLTKSKDTVYAEQVILMKKLKEKNLENCAFVKGVNLNTLATLMEIDLIDISEIKKLDLDFIRKIWEQNRYKYELSE